MDAVLAFSVQHVVTAARLAAELGLPGFRLRAALTSRNKHVQRDLFGRHNLSQLGHQIFLPAGTRLGVGRRTLPQSPNHSPEWAAEAS
jgi:hypothetical protein